MIRNITDIPREDDGTLDPHGADFVRDPHAIYAALRARGDPYWFAGFKGYLFSRFADVHAIATCPDMVRGTSGFMSADERRAVQRGMNWHDMPNHEALVQVNLLESDGPAHQRLRRAVFGAFTRSHVERLRAMVQAYADQLIDAALDMREIDFTAKIACHMPGHIIGTILGVPDEDCPQLRVWSEDVVQFFDVGSSDDDKARAEQATGEFRAYLDGLIAERRVRPREDILSMLLAAEAEGELSGVEVLATAMLILMAGHGSTIDVMGSGLHGLLLHPEAEAHLRATPDAMETAVQEMFRYETPLPFFHRYAARDVEVAGFHIPQGTRVGLLYSAANRDEAAFEDAARFDIARRPNRHLAFGMGAHLCLGNHLSRLDMDVLFQTLLARTRAIELCVDDVVYKPGLSVRGPVALPIRLTPV